MPHKKNCQCPPCCYRRGEDKGQTPRLTVRLAPEIRDYLLQHEEGARGVIERLVGEEMAGGEAASKQLAEKLAAVEAKLQEAQAKLHKSRSEAAQAEVHRVGQVSDKSSVAKTAAVAPGSLELWATRFTHTLARSRSAHKLLRPVGLDGANGRWAAQKLRLGYCSPMSSRTETDRKDLKKLGMLDPDGRERLAGCVTVPYQDPTEQLAGFCGVRVKAGKRERELVTGIGSGLLLTGLDEDLVVVDGVREALTCFGVGVAGVQALDLLTPGWFPVLWKMGVRTVKLAVGDPERAERAALELTRLGIECFWVPVETEVEARLEMFGSPFTIEGILAGRTVAGGMIRLPAAREKAKKRAR